MNDNYGFNGQIPAGASVADNIRKALDYQSTHATRETFDWFYDTVRNNNDGHLPQDQSMDYKQIDPKYADFGNFNYGAVTRALGIPDYISKLGAGWAQQKAKEKITNEEALARALLDPENYGDNPGDQIKIQEGIDAARQHGYTENNFGVIAEIDKIIRDFFSGIWDDISEVVSDAWDAAQKWILRVDPMVLDLDGDGIETTAPSSTNPILFDHDGDGIKNGTGWIKSDDGFLVLDRNGNGLIDNGTELFGDSTPLNAGGKAVDGFAALVDQDTNQDGKVNAQDANWNNLKIWRDLNQDGISQAAELSTLAALGINGLNTGKTANSQVLPNGNEIADLGTYTKTDGSVATLGEVSRMADVNLFDDTFHREFPDQIPLAAGVENLPDMQGSGKVRDLREAVSRSTSVKHLLAQHYFTQQKIAA